MEIAQKEIIIALVKMYANVQGYELREELDIFECTNLRVLGWREMAMRSIQIIVGMTEGKTACGTGQDGEAITLEEGEGVWLVHAEGNAESPFEFKERSDAIAFIEMICQEEEYAR